MGEQHDRAAEGPTLTSAAHLRRRALSWLFAAGLIVGIAVWH
jgi:hypothetical protein